MRVDASLSEALKLGDYSAEACAHRLRLAMDVHHLKSKHIVELSKKGDTTVSGMISGLQYPSRDLISVMFERYDLDYNYWYAGLPSGIPENKRVNYIEAYEKIEPAKAVLENA